MNRIALKKKNISSFCTKMFIIIKLKLIDIYVALISNNTKSYCVLDCMLDCRIVTQLFLCYDRQQWWCRFAGITQPYRFAKTPFYDRRLPFITAHDGNCRLLRRNCCYAYSPEIVKIDFKKGHI